mmetsp:Transcript_3902/g.7452  ORF Transcript_3902/g.7452 Transcript_3902/m.7452 type:complete len:333 (-) Transcript_3902:67-1065(-)
MSAFRVSNKDALFELALLAGNLSHECRNWLAAYATNDYPELQAIDQINGQIEGQLRGVAGQLRFGLVENAKRQLAQVYKKNAFLGRLVSNIESEAIRESSKDFLVQSNREQKALVMMIDEALNRAFMSALSAHDSKGAEEKKLDVEGVVRQLESIKLIKEDAKAAHEEPHRKNNIVESLSTLSVNYAKLPNFTAFFKVGDKKVLATEMWAMARAASNQAHHMQNLATRFLISQPHQPCINDVINLAGQIENQCRASLRSLGNLGTRPYDPKQMNNQVSKQVQNQVKAAKQKMDALLKKQTEDKQLHTELTSRANALQTYFDVMAASAHALAA